MELFELHNRIFMSAFYQLVFSLSFTPAPESSCSIVPSLLLAYFIRNDYLCIAIILRECLDLNRINKQ